MKKLLIAFLGLIVLTQVGCATTNTGIPINGTQITYDKFKERHREYVQIGTAVGLSAIRIGNGNRSYNLTLNARTYGDAGWYNEFVFLLDGQQMRIDGDSTLTDVNVSTYSVTYSEFGVFPMTGSQIGRIANADKVETKVYGKKQNSGSAEWDDKRKDAVRKFYRLFVLGEWDRMSPEDREEAKKPTWPSVDEEE